ncbi:MAG: hypothetical protein LBH96_06115 [Candidatus Peribacteria bacterium]|jgi:hypothetical protein|nr:hypothetical protein [Candidatus Peribacteria bacterium]
MFLNSDDFLEEDVLCEYLEQIKTNADIYYGKLRKIDNGKILSIFPNHYIWLRKILFAI